MGKVFLDGATRSRPPRAPLISYTAAVAVANASPALLSSLVLLSAFFQPARRLGSCLYRSAFSHLPTSTAASPTPDPCSGLGHYQRVSTPLPWTCSKTNNYQACSFVGVGIFDFSNLTCTLLAAGCGEEGTSTSSSAIARLSLDLALSAPITI